LTDSRLELIARESASITPCAFAQIASLSFDALSGAEAAREEIKKSKEVLASLQILHDKLQHRAALCKRILSPVRLLCNELLLIIFGWACFSNVVTIEHLRDKTSPTVRVISSVCKHWRDLAMGCSSLWRADIHFSLHPSLLKSLSIKTWVARIRALLEQPGLALQPIKMSIEASDRLSDYMRAAPIIDVLKKTTSQWEAVRFGRGYHFASNTTLHCANLISACFHETAFSSPLTLEAPYLHDLSFVNTPSPLRCVRLPWRQLTTLKVHFDTTQLSYFQFVAILVHTEALINLYLVLRSTERVPQGFKAIKLPKLQHLQIGEFLGEGVSSEFLAGVDTPSLIAMQVAWIIPGRRNSQDLVRDAMNSIQSFIVNNRNLRSVKLLACYNGQFGRTLFGDGDLNAFRLPRPANGSAIGSVELAPATPLSMRIDDTHWTKCVPHLKRTDIFDGLRSVAYANQLGENMSHHRMSSFFEQAATHRDGHGGPPESFFALDDRLIMVLFTIRSLMCCAQGLEEADVYIAF
jgi:hypothetical protein